MGTQPPSSIIQAARLAMATYKVPASVQLAQWALESGWGLHDLGCFNYFGIKALPGQPCVTVPTHEQDKYGRSYTVTAAFRKFDNATDAFTMHARLLATAPVYAAAMAALPSVPNFVSLMAPHYATDVQYAAKLMSVINGSNLTRYDNA